MVRSNRLLSFDLHTYVHPDGSWHSGLIGSLVCQMKVRYTCLLSWLKSVPSTGDKHFNYLVLVLLSLCDLLLHSSVSNSPSPFILSRKLTQVVPNVHLPAQSPDFDDGLSQEVITLTFEPLFDTRLDVVVLVPHSNLDAVRRVVAFTGWNEETMENTLKKS